MSIFQKILVPVDFSPYASYALRTAADLARRFDGSVTILHVHDALPVAFPDDLQPISKEQQAQLRAAIDKEMAALRVRAREPVSGLMCGHRRYRKLALAVEHPGFE